MLAILAAVMLAAAPQYDTVYTTDGGRLWTWINIRHLKESLPRLRSLAAARGDAPTARRPVSSATA